MSSWTNQARHIFQLSIILISIPQRRSSMSFSNHLIWLQGIPVVCRRFCKVPHQCYRMWSTVPSPPPSSSITTRAQVKRLLWILQLSSPLTESWLLIRMEPKCTRRSRWSLGWRMLLTKPCLNRLQFRNPCLNNKSLFKHRHLSRPSQRSS